MKKFFFSAAIAAAALIGVSSCSNGVPSAKMSNDLDSVAYAFGIAIGNQYSNFQDTGVVAPDVTMNSTQINNFISGIVTSIRRDSDNMKISLEEANQYIQQFQMKIRQQMQEKQMKEAAENKTKGADFMAANAQKEGVVTLESGLQIETIVEGTGKQPGDGADVKVNYKGSLIDGTVFDENEGITFNLNRVVPGFKEGLMNMKEGGKAIITMPSDLAYGDQSRPSIPGGSTLQFELELIEVVK